MSIDSEERLAQDVLRGVIADAPRGERADDPCVSFEQLRESSRSVDRPADDLAVNTHIRYCLDRPIRFTSHRDRIARRPPGAPPRNLGSRHADP
jgi:hypothetical protein